MKPDSPYDVVIVGGGIAGLWLLSVLRRAGYQAILVEKQALGAGQTLASQGILHGGTKYALAGKLTGASEAVRDMPPRWARHLAGDIQPDLRSVKINAAHQWMWGSDGLASKAASFLASKAMHSRVQALARTELPEFFRLQGVKQVYRLQEPVLDVRSLLQGLTQKTSAHCYQAAAVSVTQNPENVSLLLDSETGSARIRASAVIFSAGAGNAALQSQAMQKRPLHMVMIKGDLPTLCGHVIEVSANPRLTITSHEVSGGEHVWYLGGQLAESGSNRDSASQLQEAKKEVRQLFPGIDWQAMQWATLRVDRAEAAQAGGKRPDEPVIKQDGRCITLWPTKLVFAPLVADRVLDRLQQLRLVKTEAPAALNLPLAELGSYPWEMAAWE